MIGMETASASCPVRATLTPDLRPSRAMSVTMMAATPQPSKALASSTACMSVVSAQPCTATLPSRASMPTATWPGKARAASFTNLGSRTAAVPRMTRAMPASSQRSTPVMSRMPPPSCTGARITSRMEETALWLTEWPSNAPLRSTTCSASKPMAAKRRAWSAGSSLKEVAVVISPRSRRTHTPSLRSMAG